MINNNRFLSLYPTQTETFNYETKTRIAIIISSLIILANLINGHFFAPNGILFTPGALTMITLVMSLDSRNIRPINLSGIVTRFIILHDIGIKLYSGGGHDKESLI